MTLVLMRRGGESIDELVGRYEPQTVPTKKEIEIRGNNQLSKMLEKYKEIFKEWIQRWRFHRSEFFGTIDLQEIFRPDEINQFLQATIAYEDASHYRSITAFVVGRLVQNSYASGNNNFFLNTKGIKELFELGGYLHGEKKRLLEITIEGNCGESAFTDVCYVNGKVIGSAGRNFAFRTKKSRLYIEGDTDYGAFQHVNGVVGNINGNSGSCFGEGAKNSKLRVEGSVVPYGYLASAKKVIAYVGNFMAVKEKNNRSYVSNGKNCQVVTTDLETKRTFEEYIGRNSVEILHNNITFVYIHKDGRREVLGK